MKRAFKLHPGELLCALLDSEGITQAELHRHTGLSADLINRICQGKAVITPRTAIFLGQAFNNGPWVWLSLQNAYDVDCISAGLTKVVGTLVDLRLNGLPKKRSAR